MESRRYDLPSGPNAGRSIQVFGPYFALWSSNVVQIFLKCNVSLKSLPGAVVIYLVTSLPQSLYRKASRRSDPVFRSAIINLSEGIPPVTICLMTRAGWGWPAVSLSRFPDWPANGFFVPKWALTGRDICTHESAIDPATVVGKLPLSYWRQAGMRLVCAQDTQIRQQGISSSSWTLVPRRSRRSTRSK